MRAATSKPHRANRLQPRSQLLASVQRNRTQSVVADCQGDVQSAGQPLKPAGDVHRVTDDGLFPAGRTEGHHAVMHTDADRDRGLADGLAFVVPAGNSLDHGKAAGDAATRIARLQVVGAEQRHEPVAQVLVHDAVKGFDDCLRAGMKVVEECEGLVWTHPGSDRAVALDIDEHHRNRPNAEIALLGRPGGAPWPAALAASIASLLGLVAGPEECDILDLRPARWADRPA